MSAVAPLISAQELDSALKNTPRKILLCDCSYDLSQPHRGAELYREAHLAGAVYLDLHADLAGMRTEKSGRHPLPEKEMFVRRLAELGVDDDTWAIAYDNANGMFAARLWWMLGWVGHTRRSVLDGTMANWQQAGLRVAAISAQPTAQGNITLRPSLHKTVEYQEVRQDLGAGHWQLVDARNAERFRGENETMDPKAGHIPGAKNRFFTANLTEEGFFKPAAQLKDEWLELLAGHPLDRVVNQCGSGVTACHNLLALEVAGLSGARLYPGSWSEWCQYPDAPVAVR